MHESSNPTLATEMVAEKLADCSGHRAGRQLQDRTVVLAAPLVAASESLQGREVPLFRVGVAAYRACSLGGSDDRTR
jgi:hypothetical protein